MFCIREAPSHERGHRFFSVRFALTLSLAVCGSVWEGITHQKASGSKGPGASSTPSLHIHYFKFLLPTSFFPFLSCLLACDTCRWFSPQAIEGSYARARRKTHAPNCIVLVLPVYTEQQEKLHTAAAFAKQGPNQPYGTAVGRSVGSLTRMADWTRLNPTPDALQISSPNVADTKVILSPT